MLELIDQENRRSLRLIAEAEAQDFLQTQLRRVETKISSQRDHLERYYNPEDTSRHGVEKMLQVYAQEKALIEELMKDCKDEILPDVFYRRLLETERQLTAAREKGLSSIGAESSYWQLGREAEMLKDLLRRWNRSFRTSTFNEGQA
jgi:hypothetical protein